MPFIVFQTVPLLALPIWFLLFLFFDTGARTVAERGENFAVCLLFGSQWFVPLFFLVCSLGMWVAVALRLNWVARSMAISLCLPLIAMLIMLLLQYRASVT
jgi:hypothetical protein